MELFLTPCCGVPMDFRLFCSLNPMVRVVCRKCTKGYNQSEACIKVLDYDEAILLIKKYFRDDNEVLIEAYKRRQANVNAGKREV